jgi:predicted membrane protein
MKMGPGTFWGLLLILIGAALIIKVLFHIEIPVFKVVIAAFFILIGLKILFGNFHFHKFRNNGNDVIFGEMRITADNLEFPEYNIIFGKGVFDLRNLNLENGSQRLKIATVFGGAEIILPENLPVKITSDFVFSGGKLPDGNSTAFGSSTYISPEYDPMKPHFNLRIEGVFSGVDVKRH